MISRRRQACTQVPERKPRVRDKYAGRLVFLPFDGADKKTALWKERHKGMFERSAPSFYYWLSNYLRRALLCRSSLFGNKREWVGIQGTSVGFAATSAVLLGEE